MHTEMSTGRDLHMLVFYKKEGQAMFCRVRYGGVGGEPWRAYAETSLPPPPRDQP